jgi:uncharacterized protein involved in exopolysaccharide biosynthesis
VQLLQDWDVLRPVVISSGLANAQHSAWWHIKDDTSTRTARAVRRLATRLQVIPLRKTRLISVTYECGNPDIASRVLHELSSVYLQKHLEAQRPEGASAFFEQQAQAYRKALDDADGRLVSMIHNRGVVSPAMQRDLILQKLTESDSQYRQISLQTRETEERIRALNNHLASLPDRRTTEVRNADNPELLQQLKSTLLNLELKRTDLLTKYQPGYRLVQEVEQQISDTHAAIAGEQLAPIRQETTDNEPRYDWAAGELAKAEVEFRTLRARETAAAALVASYQKAAQRLGEQVMEHEDLVRAAKVAEENYLLYLRKREEARMGDALDAHGILNVTQVQSPVVPALPKWSFTSISAAAFVLALLLSTGLAFVTDYLAPGYRTPDEVRTSLGVPTLASLPREAA